MATNAEMTLARLQEQVEEAIKRGVMLWQQFVWLLWAVDRECAAAEQAQAERDGYKAQAEEWQSEAMLWENNSAKAEALAKVRGEALEARGCERGWPSRATCLTVGTEDDPLGANTRPPIEVHLRCPSCAAIAMTPEEAREKADNDD